MLTVPRYESFVNPGESAYNIAMLSHISYSSESLLFDEREPYTKLPLLAISPWSYNTQLPIPTHRQPYYKQIVIASMRPSSCQSAFYQSAPMERICSSDSYGVHPAASISRRDGVKRLSSRYWENIPVFHH